MIRYALKCSRGHGFEGWFSGSGDFEDQRARGIVTCPVCGSAEIAKQLMAPAVSSGRGREEIRALAMDAAQRQALAKVKESIAAIRANAEDVGEKFPEEARKIHYGEAEDRGIIGRASAREANALAEEGIEVVPLPTLPGDVN